MLGKRKDPVQALSEQKLQKQIREDHTDYIYVDSYIKDDKQEKYQRVSEADYAKKVTGSRRTKPILYINDNGKHREIQPLCAVRKIKDRKKRDDMFIYVTTYRKIGNKKTNYVRVRDEDVAKKTTARVNGNIKFYFNGQEIATLHNVEERYRRVNKKTKTKTKGDRNFLPYKKKKLYFSVPGSNGLHAEVPKEQIIESDSFGKFTMINNKREAVVLGRSLKERINRAKEKAVKQADEKSKAALCVSAIVLPLPVSTMQATVLSCASSLVQNPVSIADPVQNPVLDSTDLFAGIPELDLSGLGEDPMSEADPVQNPVLDSTDPFAGIPELDLSGLGEDPMSDFASQSQSQAQGLVGTSQDLVQSPIEVDPTTDLSSSAQALRSLQSPISPLLFASSPHLFFNSQDEDFASQCLMDDDDVSKPLFGT